jgi:DNA polymerase-3 subunit gamma/tau
MMVKDTQTHKLMEVSESIQLRFKEQAEKTSYGILLNALNIAHQFEYSFKASSNKRLHIELALMKINALPYMAKGQKVEDAPKALEFKHILAYPVSNVKSFAPVSKKEHTSRKSSGKLKLTDKLQIRKSHKEAVLIKDQELNEIPKLQANVLNEYESKPEAEMLENTVAEDAPEKIINEGEHSVDVKQDFNQVNVKNALTELAEDLIKQNKKAAAYLVKEADFAIKDKSILYNFSSSIELRQFKSCIIEINRMLKETFGPGHAIETMVTIEEKEAKKIYSESQKFANMIAENKGVKKLVDALKLQIKK